MGKKRRKNLSAELQVCATTPQFYQRHFIQKEHTMATACLGIDEVG